MCPVQECRKLLCHLQEELRLLVDLQGASEQHMLHDQLCIGIAISANVWNPKQMSRSSCLALHLLKALCTGDSARAISCRPYNTEVFAPEDKDRPIRV